MDQRKIKVSVYRNATDTQNQGTVNLLRWLEGFERFNPLVDQIRQTQNPEKRAELKKQLPGITPSGIFKERKASGLISHSGFIALDFDHLSNPAATKQTLAGISNVFYAGLSVSGAGIWALIPIRYTEHHKRHFEALRADFAPLGLKLDNCPDVCRLRFYSYDPAPVLNLDAVTYNKLAPEPIKHHARPRSITPVSGNVFDLAVNWVENVKGLRFADGSKHSYLLNLSRYLQLSGIPQHEAETFIEANFIDLSCIKSNCVKYVYN